MVEKLKQIPAQILEQWNKYSSKVKTIIVSVVAMVLISLVILVAIMNRVTYKQLFPSKTTQQAHQVSQLLGEQGIPYQLAKDGLTILVDEKRFNEALLTIYGSDLFEDGVTLKDLQNNSLSTTNSDRTLKNHLYAQTELRKTLVGIEGIVDARVSYVPVNNTYSVLSDKKDYPASVALTINDSFNPNKAEAIAATVASAIGNESTDKIRIIDQKGNLLFGGQDDLYSGNANSVLEYRTKLQNTYDNNLIMLMMELGYDDVRPMFNWVLDMKKVDELFTEIIPAEGQDQGLYKNYYSYDAQNTNGTPGGAPGTDSNDETTYEMEDGTGSGSTVSTQQIEYMASVRETNTQYEVGAIIKEESSGSVVATRVVYYKEEELELQGLLDNVTFEEYALLNSERKQVPVDDEVYELVSLATGVAREKIKLMAYEQPVFIPRVVEERDITFYISIALAVLIIALLVYVIIKATAKDEITELEPELSVEQLLATTKENQGLDDIEFNEQSETKKMIDKFVDENPEAVAQLLRNWLNDDWG